ncbi:chromate efflux transporter [Motilimonas eburnea]|uniref:chromate efflux transporter n=1 Tax=Motilimonas eburnea TaxID=1737488 RepID=UPI001E58243E|nr:chromate efflux transporter [Motilimonas eburnea]MCE2570650.1 chromate efflux transporter [Motilimonas eburnea]
MKAVVDIFTSFFLLGLHSFGGPAAHIGYFKKAFVDEKKWLSEQDYQGLVALSQMLPGPGSSQVGFALGLKRAGLAGGMAAFLGFTLPSFLLLLGLALYSQGQQPDWLQAVIHGLKLLAVVVVVDAVLNMYRSFCQTRLLTAMAVLSAAALLLVPGVATQFVVFIVAALVCFKWHQAGPIESDVSGKMKVKIWALGLFILLFLGLPWLTQLGSGFALFNDFYQAGSLVFGGGHVVLPLLEQSLHGQVSQDTFLFGYAAAQAVPGPMFSLAAFLGAYLDASPIWGALLATLAIFLPGFLLVLAFMQSWQQLSLKPWFASASAGINAAVVGLLLAALYQPVFTSAVISAVDMVAVILGLFALRGLKLKVMWLVFGALVLGLGLHLIG